MIIEESEEVSKYVNVSSPRAGRMLWRKIQIYLPMVAFCIVGGSEMAVITAWGNDSKMSLFLMDLLAMIGLSLSPIFFLTLTSLRFRKGNKYKIEICADGIKSPCAGIGLVPWERVTKLCLEKWSDADDMARLRIDYLPKPATSIWTRQIFVPRSRSTNTGRAPVLRMPVAHPRQSKLVARELDQLRQAGKPVPQLTTNLYTPFKTRWLYMSMVGVFLLFHGLPLLGIGLEHTFGNPTTQTAGNGSERTSKMAEKLGPILVKHFHSVEGIYRFYIQTGSVVTLVGAFLYVGAFVGTRREKASKSTEIGWKLPQPGRAV